MSIKKKLATRAWGHHPISFMKGGSMGPKSPQTHVSFGRATCDGASKPPRAEGIDGGPADPSISIGSGVTIFNIHVTTTALSEDQATTEMRNLLHSVAHYIPEGKRNYTCHPS